MSARHRFVSTESMAEGHVVQRCAVCDVERIPVPNTKTLFLWRGGRAFAPSGRKVPDTWTGYVSGVIPRCTGQQA